jgi:hypothetical protein
MTLWYKPVSSNESLTLRCDERPGDDWYQLPRDPTVSEAVDVIDGRAVIIPPAEPEPEAPLPAADPRRELVAAALPDILLAVADGADLREEIRKVLSDVNKETPGV